MKPKILSLLFFVSLFQFSIMGQTLDGDWEGDLHFGATTLPLKLHVNTSDNSVIMDSPAQGAFGMKCNTEYLANDSIAFSISQLMMNYRGRLLEGKIEGTFRQGGLTLPLTFDKATVTPVEEVKTNEVLPYSTEEVEINNLPANVVLSGTLTLPDNYSKATPIAVLVSGSGLQNRDEETFGHKPFAVIADYLARNGIASIRYDDRGFGKSTGDGINATTTDFASDTQSVINWLKESNRFSKIGIIGHSEGGLIAYQLADSTNKQTIPDYIISIAGPTVKGSEIIADQNRFALINSGLSEEEATTFACSIKNLLNMISNSSNTKSITPAMISEAAELSADSPLYSAYKLAADKMLASIDENPWLREFIALDPTPHLMRINIPALIIFGEKDRQVSAEMNSKNVQLYSPKSVVKTFKELNHLMQHATTGSIEEYAKISETFAPEVLQEIVAFIKK